MHIQTIAHGSKEYEQMIQLRTQVLLQPIGVPADYIDRENEKGDYLIGAFEEEELIGCCVLTPKGNGEVQLRQMAVRTEFQGRRIGAAIIDFAEEFSRQKGFGILMMHARNPVIHFYKKCGYKVWGEEFREVGIGHYQMRKDLV